MTRDPVLTRKPRRVLVAIRPAVVLLAATLIASWSSGPGALAQIGDMPSNVVAQAARDSLMQQIVLDEIDKMIEVYGEDLPDEWHPPVPPDPNDTVHHKPDPFALGMVRQAYAESLREHGFFDKANRVDQINVASGATSLPLVPSNEAKWATVMLPQLRGLARSVTTAYELNSDYSCDDANDGQIVNNSGVFIRIQGDWQALSFDCKEGWSGWVCPGCTVGNGVGGWEDTDHMWNCFGDLTVDSTTISGGAWGWHHRDGVTTTITDDPAYPHVRATSCWWRCGWQKWSNC